VALIVLGQMVGAMLFDHFALLGVPENPITPTRMAGVALLIGGVVLIRL
jgi:bacterial/archaeal transporter family-2 protein